ncbi:DUF397 domain-containing protein [Nocardia cyriacigeorgica]|uniref:DUF397 domain-containing protein n=1 Tax=Nocardia cyriacigeorgica TaxID=135487 RepID=A0A6P1CYK4_9NOCA|nr:DUF397 domain-containing protein [Nocardia cyriacigeorgica]MBF6427105.1 DUF397 domain-containing protein [Nocardia cyriacigeorgica]NEW36624.1 DUF397 domain-containing protein [Nocardia cyriacigeorgica]
MDSELVGAKWFKSRRSSAGSDCVEVAHLGSGLVGVRDSKNPSGPALVFTPSEWDSFLTRARAGRFDRR